MAHDGFDEWYLFADCPGLSSARICTENVFVTLIPAPNGFRFINFGRFSLSDRAVSALTDLFWRQVQWIRPESYVGDGESWLIFITRNRELFAKAMSAVDTSRRP